MVPFQIYDLQIFSPILWVFTFLMVSLDEYEIWYSYEVIYLFVVAMLLVSCLRILWQIQGNEDFSLCCLLKLLCVCLLSHLSHVWLLATPWTVACQASPSMGFFQARILKWMAMPSSREFSRPRDWVHVSYVSPLAGGFFLSYSYISDTP